MSLGLASQERSNGAPSPPRIVVPPLAIDRHSQNHLVLLQDPNKSLNTNNLAHLHYLESVASYNFRFRDDALEWRYEERRQAQPILPFLYLGPISAARDRHFLEKNGITMVLAVRDAQTAKLNLLNPKAPRDIGLHVLYLDVQNNQQLIATFDRAVEEINAHLASVTIPGHAKALIFCESGNERSATVVAAYIMSAFSVNVIQAIQLVQSQRISVAIDDNGRFLLQSYETLLEARRAVAKQPDTMPFTTKQNSAGALEQVASQSDSWSTKPVKRTILEFYEDEMKTEEPNDPLYLARFDRRESLAPFVDSESHTADH